MFGIYKSVGKYNNIYNPQTQGLDGIQARAPASRVISGTKLALLTVNFCVPAYIGEVFPLPDRTKYAPFTSISPTDYHNHPPGQEEAASHASRRVTCFKFWSFGATNRFPSLLMVGCMLPPSAYFPHHS